MNNSDSEEYATGSSAGEDSDAASVDFRGGLRTRMCWDLGQKQLSVKLRQSLENSRRLEIKYKADLNTSSGAHSHTGYLRKSFYTHSPIGMQRVLEAAAAQRSGGRPSDPDVDPDRMFPAGAKALFLNDWVLSPGLAFGSASQRKVQYALTLRKAPQFVRHSPKFDSWLSGKVVAQVDPKTTQVTTNASARLKLLRYGLTDKQDLSVSIGVDAGAKGGMRGGSQSGPGEGGLSVAPYFRVSENSLGFKLQAGRMSLFYEI
ncbi:hypothetical protein FOA52_014539 [Chlamydomonas sp. UWO 241]|nr:hypothetical protein FOA52_014539 [Chlamydomonas sp. UWO 241]